MTVLYGNERGTIECSRCVRAANWMKGFFAGIAEMVGLRKQTELSEEAAQILEAHFDADGWNADEHLEVSVPEATLLSK